MQPTITSVDPREGTITVKMADRQGQAVEKIFHLTEDVEYVDSTGRVATLDVLECGDEILVIEMEGQIKELRRASQAPPGLTGPKTTKPASISSRDKSSRDKRPDNQLVSKEDIRLRAYQKWESAGKPSGDGVPFWLDAERELVQGRAS